MSDNEHVQGDREALAEAMLLADGYLREHLHVLKSDTSAAWYRALRYAEAVLASAPWQDRVEGARALREAASALPAFGDGGGLEFVQDWLRDRADRIERDGDTTINERYVL